MNFWIFPVKLFVSRRDFKDKFNLNSIIISHLFGKIFMSGNLRENFRLVRLDDDVCYLVVVCFMLCSRVDLQQAEEQWSHWWSNSHDSWNFFCSLALEIHHKNYFALSRLFISLFMEILEFLDVHQVECRGEWRKRKMN